MIQKIKSGQPYKNSTKVSSATPTGQYAAFPVEFGAQNISDKDNLIHGNKNLPLLVSSSGNSQSFYVPEGDHSLVITASSWGSAALQVSFDNITFMAAEDGAGAITFTANKSIVISGNLFYRLNVSSYSAQITVNCRVSEK